VLRKIGLLFFQHSLISFCISGTASLETGVSDLTIDVREGSRYTISKCLWDFLEEKHGVHKVTKKQSRPGVSIRQ
jgi:hypothetical protein